jgi:competence protein ComEC
MDLKAYPILRLVLFLILGILLFEYSSISTEVIVGVGILGVLLTAVGLYFKRNLFNAIGVFLSISILGWTSAFIAKPSETSVLNEEIEAYMVQINSSTENKPKSYKTTGEVYKVRKDSTWQTVDHQNTVLLYFSKDEPRPVYGDIYVINQSPRAIEGPKNRLEFDYKLFQQRRGITHHHFLRQGDFQKIGNSPKSFIFKWAYSLNSLSGEKLSQFLPVKANLAVAEAMLSGSKDELDNDVREAYATAGAVHILAVSGLHVGILLIMLNMIFGFLNKHKKTKWLYGFMTISCLWAYALFTGLSPSVTRATLMFSLFQAGSLMLRDKNSINVLAGSALLLLLIKPFWIFEVGFQLSYLAIFGILYLFPYLNQLYQPKNWLLSQLWQISMVSIAAQLFTFPLSIYYFHQFPSYFLLTNPIVTILSMGVLFFGIPSLLFSWVPLISDLLNALLNITLTILNSSIFAISALPNSKLDGFSINTWEVILLYIFLFLGILFFIKKEVKYLFASVLLFFGFGVWNVYQDYNQKNQSEITFHFIPRSSGFTLINSKSAVFVTDSATAHNDRAYNFHLKNYYDDKGVKSYKVKVPESENGMLSFDLDEQPCLWIKKYYRGKIKDEFSKVIISNNAVSSFEKQFEVYPEEVIMDDTNSKWRIAALKTQADSLGIKLISLYETGGITYPL